MTEEPLPKNYLVRLWTYFLPQEKSIPPATKQWLESKMPLAELVQKFTLPRNFWRAVMEANADLIDNLLTVVREEKLPQEQPNKTSGWLMNAFQAWVVWAGEAKKRNGQKRADNG